MIEMRLSFPQNIISKYEGETLSKKVKTKQVHHAMLSDVGMKKKNIRRNYPT